jgi:hypothetical protein
MNAPAGGQLLLREPADAGELAEVEWCDREPVQDYLDEHLA